MIMYSFSNYVFFIHSFVRSFVRSFNRSFCLFVFLPNYLLLILLIYLFTFTYLLIYLFIYLFTYYFSIGLSVSICVDLLTICIVYLGIPMLGMQYVFLSVLQPFGWDCSDIWPVWSDLSPIYWSWHAFIPLAICLKLLACMKESGDKNWYIRMGLSDYNDIMLLCVDIMLFYVRHK